MATDPEEVLTFERKSSLDGVAPLTDRALQQAFEFLETHKHQGISAHSFGSYLTLALGTTLEMALIQTLLRLATVEARLTEVEAKLAK
jgi:uncharacterized tellurite resistance protein B-like protein